MKIVITDYEFEDARYEQNAILDNDIELVAKHCKTEEDVIEACKDADALINQYAPITETVIQKLDKCKVIARYGVGVDTIDIEAATKKGICVANVPDYGVDEVSDHALTLILNLLRKVTFSDQKIKHGTWDINLAKPIHRLRDLKVGLLGFGNIPKRLSEKLQMLGFEVYVYDPFIKEEEAKEHNVVLTTFEELCKKVDVVSVHVPLTPATKGMLGKEQFELMQKGVFIVNTARGPIIEEDDLIDALKSGQVGGAGLDVFAKEPLPKNSLLTSFENIILTPHMAGYSKEAYIEMRTKAVLGTLDVLAYNQFPKYLVNKEVESKSKLNTFKIKDHYNMSNYM